MQEEYHRNGFAIVKGVFTIEKSIDLNIWRALANIAGRNMDESNNSYPAFRR